MKKSGNSVKDIEKEIDMKKHRRDPFCQKYVDFVASDNRQTHDLLDENVLDELSINLRVKSNIIHAQIEHLSKQASNATKKYLSEADSKPADNTVKANPTSNTATKQQKQQSQLQSKIDAKKVLLRQYVSGEISLDLDMSVALQHPWLASLSTRAQENELSAAAAPALHHAYVSDSPVVETKVHTKNQLDDANYAAPTSELVTLASASIGQRWSTSEICDDLQRCVVSLLATSPSCHTVAPPPPAADDDGGFEAEKRVGHEQLEVCHLGKLLKYIKPFVLPDEDEGDDGEIGEGWQDDRFPEPAASTTLSAGVEVGCSESTRNYKVACTKFDTAAGSVQHLVGPEPLADDDDHNDCHNDDRAYDHDYDKDYGRVDGRQLVSADNSLLHEEDRLLSSSNHTRDYYRPVHATFTVENEEVCADNRTDRSCSDRNGLSRHVAVDEVEDLSVHQVEADSVANKTGRAASKKPPPKSTTLPPASGAPPNVVTTPFPTYAEVKKTFADHTRELRSLRASRRKRKQNQQAMEAANLVQDAETLLLAPADEWLYHKGRNTRGSDVNGSDWMYGYDKETIWGALMPSEDQGEEGVKDVGETGTYLGAEARRKEMMSGEFDEICELFRAVQASADVIKAAEHEERNSSGSMSSSSGRSGGGQCELSKEKRLLTGDEALKLCKRQIEEGTLRVGSTTSADISSVFCSLRGMFTHLCVLMEGEHLACDRPAGFTGSNIGRDETQGGSESSSDMEEGQHMALAMCFQEGALGPAAGEGIVVDAQSAAFRVINGSSSLNGTSLACTGLSQGSGTRVFPVEVLSGQGEDVVSFAADEKWEEGGSGMDWEDKAELLEVDYADYDGVGMTRQGDGAYNSSGGIEHDDHWFDCTEAGGGVGRVGRTADDVWEVRVTETEQDVVWNEEEMFPPTEHDESSPDLDLAHQIRDVQDPHSSNDQCFRLSSQTEGRCSGGSLSFTGTTSNMAHTETQAKTATDSNRGIRMIATTTVPALDVHYLLASASSDRSRPLAVGLGSGDDAGGRRAMLEELLQQARTGGGKLLGLTEIQSRIQQCCPPAPAEARIRLVDILSPEEVTRGYPGIPLAEAQSRYTRRVVVAAVALADTYNHLQFARMNHADSGCQRSPEELAKDDTMGLLPQEGGCGRPVSDKVNKEELVSHADTSKKRPHSSLSDYRCPPCWQMNLVVVDRKSEGRESNTDKQGGNRDTSGSEVMLIIQYIQFSPGL